MKYVGKWKSAHTRARALTQTNKRDFFVTLMPAAVCGLTADLCRSFVNVTPHARMRTRVKSYENLLLAAAAASISEVCDDVTIAREHISPTTTTSYTHPLVHVCACSICFISCCCPVVDVVCGNLTTGSPPSCARELFFQ